MLMVSMIPLRTLCFHGHLWSIGAHRQPVSQLTTAIQARAFSAWRSSCSSDSGSTAEPTKESPGHSG